MPVETPRFPFNSKAQAAFDDLQRRKELRAQRARAEIDDVLSSLREVDPAEAVARLADEEARIATAAIDHLRSAIGHLTAKEIPPRGFGREHVPSSANPFTSRHVMEMRRASPDLTAKNIALIAKSGRRDVFKEELEQLNDPGREAEVAAIQEILPYEFAAILNKEEKHRKPADLLQEIRWKYSELYPGFFDALTAAFTKIRHNEIDDYDARAKLEELGKTNIYFAHDIQKITKIIVDKPWLTVNDAMEELRKSGYTSDYFDLIGTAIEMAVTTPKSASSRKGGPQSVRRSA